LIEIAGQGATDDVAPAFEAAIAIISLTRRPRGAKRRILRT
jgi:hypothetical protein